jgi:iron complex transport system substrate-binding protein
VSAGVFILQYTKPSTLCASRANWICLGLIIALLNGVACDNRKAGTENPRIITDELGRTIRVAQSPQRIVSLAPSVTETLFALGLKDKIVGVTTFCNYPPEATAKEKVGDTLRPNIEKIVALKPDLVIASTASQLEAFVKNLEAAAVPVYVSNPRTLKEAINSIEKIGEATGATSQANELVEVLRARINLVHERHASSIKPKVFVMLGGEPLITIGSASFINDLITQSGGVSISADDPGDYPQYSLETVIARQPEVIFLQAGDEKLPERLRETPAARNGRIYHLDDDLLLRPGPRIVEGLEQIAAKISRQ